MRPSDLAILEDPDADLGAVIAILETWGHGPIHQRIDHPEDAPPVHRAAFTFEPGNVLGLGASADEAVRDLGLEVATIDGVDEVAP